MFLRLFGLKTIESYWDENTEKKIVNYGFTAEAFSLKISYSMDDYSTEGKDEIVLNSLVRPTLGTAFLFTISTKKGDPEDPTVSEGQLATLTSFNVDQHSMLRLNFKLESNKEGYVVFMPTSLLSTEDSESIKPGKKYYLNLRGLKYLTPDDFKQN